MNVMWWYVCFHLKAFDFIGFDLAFIFSIISTLIKNYPCANIFESRKILLFYFCFYFVLSFVLLCVSEEKLRIKAKYAEFLWMVSMWRCCVGNFHQFQWLIIIMIQIGSQRNVCDSIFCKPPAHWNCVESMNLVAVCHGRTEFQMKNPIYDLEMRS